jgi:hypothetical protein
MKKNLAKIEPNPLSIKISKDNENKVPNIITIQNLTNKFLIFKLLINNKGILLAKPSTSYILPSQNISVEINVYQNNLSIDVYKKTKILITFIPCDEEIKSVEQAKNLFLILKKNGVEKQETFLDLNFIMEEIINTDIVQGGDFNKNENNIYNNNNNYLNNKQEKLILLNDENTKNELISKNKEIVKNIEINRKKLENLMEQNYKINEKSKNKIHKKYNCDNLIMITLILLGLIIGSNFATVYNKLYKNK